MVQAGKLSHGTRCARPLIDAHTAGEIWTAPPGVEGSRGRGITGLAFQIAPREHEHGPFDPSPPDPSTPLEFRDHFSGIAPDYAAYRPRYPEPLFDFLAECAPARTLAWDCGCGSGQATIDLAARFDRVIGTDPSAAQIAQAPPHPRIEWRVAPGERSEIPSATCDLVTVAQALHWLDVDAFFREAARVARPGGLVAVWTYGDVRLDAPDADSLVRHFARAIVGPYWPPQRRIVDEGYRSITMPFDEIEVPKFEMKDRWTLDHLVGYICTWSATSRYREALKEDPTIELAARLGEVWRDPAEARGVWWPLVVRVGRLRTTAD